MSESPQDIHEELIAYLDGEVDLNEGRRIEAALGSDAELRDEIRQHQQAWELLDMLPRIETDESFTASTVEMIALRDTGSLPESSPSGVANWRTMAIATAAVVAAAVGGFLAVAVLTPNPNEALVRDLEVIENLDRYRQVESIEFLRSLEETGLFAEDIARVEPDAEGGTP